MTSTGAVAQSDYAAPSLHGPYAWLIKPIGLAEDHWTIEADPSPYPECISVPLFAKEAQYLVRRLHQRTGI